MADQNTPAAGAVAEIDYDKLGSAVAKALGPSIGTAISDANKPLIEQLGKLQPPAPEQQQNADANKNKPLTFDDVSKLLDTKLQAQQTDSQRAAARAGYQSDKLKDLPSVYRDRLGNDPTKWAAEEQQIRDTYKSDLKAAGITVKPVGGENAAGKAPGAPVDISKLNPVQKIAMGLKSSQPQMNAAANANAQAKTDAQLAANAAVVQQQVPAN